MLKVHDCTFKDATHRKPCVEGYTSHVVASLKAHAVTNVIQDTHAEAASAMNCLAWDCMGIDGSCTVCALVSLVQVHHPLFDFLCETRQAKKKVRRLSNHIGLRGFVVVSSSLFSGGLAFFWDDQMHVKSKDLNDQYIDVYVQASLCYAMWRLTCVYGGPKVGNKHLMWGHLRNLKES